MTLAEANTLLPLAVLACFVRHLDPTPLLPILAEHWDALSEEKQAEISYRGEESVKWKHQHWEVWRELLKLGKEEAP